MHTALISIKAFALCCRYACAVISMHRPLAPVNSAEKAGAAGDSPQFDTCVLDVFDMHCAACAVLIESALRAAAGVCHVRVHYATQRARVTFDPALTSVEKLVKRIDYLGYAADAGAGVGTTRIDIARRQRHRHIWGFGLSAFCAMQIMMLTLPRFWAGADMEPELAPLLDWAAFLLLLPVIGWTARPFYRGALREFRLRQPGMDSAVTLGIVSAFAGSIWHLLAGTGALYFDSVAMFVALLLGVRWFEWEQRERSQAIIHAASASAPCAEVMRIDSAGAAEHVLLTSISAVSVGDRLWIRTGEAVPVDATLESAVADLNESLLTGESASVRRVSGRTLNAGAVNVGPAIVIRATHTVDASTERRLMNLADDADKPESLALADLVARYFMPAVALVAVATFVALLPSGVGIAAERAIAVLIISCPCALALAAPAAHAKAFAGLLSRGIVLRRTEALARLAKADAFLLDKTGTLSVPHINGIVSLRPGFNEAAALTIIATLERAASHPLAVALRRLELRDAPGLTASDLCWTPGDGVSGTIAGVAYRFGRAEFVGATADAAYGINEASWLWLGDPHGAVGALDVSEIAKSGAHSLVQALQRRGTVEILSGDHVEKTRALAASLGIRTASGAQTPEQKALRVRQLQQEGRTTVMIGDGINDSISFAGADVAIAVFAASDAARSTADVLCMNPDLTAIDAAIDYARLVQTVVRGNFMWAISYNLIAIPIAVMGVINPLIASVGMALSSAVVMLNVMRLGRAPEVHA
jgi:P-type Cu2+ transporter